MKQVLPKVVETVILIPGQTTVEQVRNAETALKKFLLSLWDGMDIGGVPVSVNIETNDICGRENTICECWLTITFEESVRNREYTSSVSQGYIAGYFQVE